MSEIPKDIQDKIDEYAMKESCSPSDYEWIRFHIIFGYSLAYEEVKELKLKCENALDEQMKIAEEMGDLNEQFQELQQKDARIKSLEEMLQSVLLVTMRDTILFREAKQLLQNKQQAF